MSVQTLAAAAYFAANPAIDTALVTADGNVFRANQVNLADFHRAQYKLAANTELQRADLTAAIATATLAITGDTARLSAYHAIEATIEPPKMSVAATHSEAKSALTTALGIADLTDLDEDYTVDGTTVTLETMVVCTWKASKLSAAAWKAQSKVTRQAAVKAAFPDFITE